MSVMSAAISAEVAKINANSFPNIRDQRDVIAQAAASVPSRLAERKQDREFKKAKINVLTDQHDLQFTYIRRFEKTRFPFLGEILPFGGVTIAYKVPMKGAKVVEVATAVCSKKDVFDKVEGKYLAVKNFNEGKTVKIVIPQGSHYGQVLRDMFQA